ncbi:MAG: hypothetical protein L3J89_08255 [Gammaproteobacteria bacterium]|nr:hypothetical protein [Gammaproteobacteria bacterium]
MPTPTPDLPENQVIPAPALEKRSRRQYTAEHKLRIITEASACKHGQLGAMLRREKRYSNQLSASRREYAERGVDGLSKSSPGPAASKTAEQRQNEQLIKENDRLKRKLEVANDCLDLQKKALSMLDHLRSGSDA